MSYAIFSVESLWQTVAEREFAHKAAIDLLEDTNSNYDVVLGCYDGVLETSYITANLEVARHLAQLYNQHSYFEQGAKGFWYLIDTHTNRVIDWYRSIQKVSEARALRESNYTFFQGNYYIGTK